MSSCQASLKGLQIEAYQQATQQIIAPDWLQLRSCLTTLPPAGEFRRCAAARGLDGEHQSTLVADVYRFWSSMVDMFRLGSKYFGGATGGDSGVLTAAQQGAAHRRPTACARSSLRLLGAGELDRPANPLINPL